MKISLISLFSQIDITPLPGNDNKKDYAQNAWDNGLNIVFAIFGATALLMIVINGFLYITAAGDPQKTAQARLGLLYSAIGLVIILFATVIVTFVIRGVA